MWKGVVIKTKVFTNTNIFSEMSQDGMSHWWQMTINNQVAVFISAGAYVIKFQLSNLICMTHAIDNIEMNSSTFREIL